jgi:hypothetical protein
MTARGTDSNPMKTDLNPHRSANGRAAAYS